MRRTKGSSLDHLLDGKEAQEKRLRREKENGSRIKSKKEVNRVQFPGGAFFYKFRVSIKNKVKHQYIY